MPAPKEGPPPLAIFPPEVEWRGVGPGLVVYKAVTIKNTDSKKVHIVRVKAPRTGPLTVKGLDFTEKLAPGLSINLDLEFSSKALTEDFKSTIHVQTESGCSIAVPVRALKPRAEIEHVGDLNFGDVLADTPISRTVKLVNNGEVDTKLQLVKPKLPIEVSPSSFKLPARGGTCDVTVTFVGGKALYDGEVVLQLKDGSTYGIPMIARSAPHQVKIVDKNGEAVKELAFGLAYYGQTLSKTIILVNSNAVPAEYTIHYGTAESMRTLDDQQSSGSNKDPHADFLKVSRGNATELAHCCSWLSDCCWAACHTFP